MGASGGFCGEEGLGRAFGVDFGITFYASLKLIIGTLGAVANAPEVARVNEAALAQEPPDHAAERFVRRDEQINQVHVVAGGRQMGDDPLDASRCAADFGDDKVLALHDKTLADFVRQSRALLVHGIGADPALELRQNLLRLVRIDDRCVFVNGNLFGERGFAGRGRAEHDERLTLLLDRTGL